MYITPEIVIGFHGCDKFVADAVFKEGKELSKSENSYDWLGHGIYFWEGSYERAWEWARNKKEANKIDEPAVIGAFIKLGYCLDLLDSKHIKTVKLAHNILLDESQKTGVKLPENTNYKLDISFYRHLDCTVM
ncbi:MAG: hypothetical protein WAX77_08485 [Methylococcaceae bacterium]